MSIGLEKVLPTLLKHLVVRRKQYVLNNEANEYGSTNRFVATRCTLHWCSFSLSFVSVPSLEPLEIARIIRKVDIVLLTVVCVVGSLLIWVWVVEEVEAELADGFVSGCWLFEGGILCKIAGVVYMGLRCCIVVGLFHSIASSLADGFDSFGSLMWVDASRVSCCLQGYTCVQGSCVCFEWWDWLSCLAYECVLQWLL